MENISGTIDKALKVLDIFLKQDAEIGLSEIAELSGFNTATVHRLVFTMVKNGLLCQKQKNGKYSLGLKTLEFCFKVRGNLHYLDTTFLYMSKLCREQNVNINLTVLGLDDQVVVDEIGIGGDFRYTAPIGKRLPLHATTCGKIFLAYMSEADRSSFFKRNSLEQITRNTITDKDRLIAELETVKRDGLAFDEEQYLPGVWAVSAPIFNGKGEIATVATIVLPMSQVDALRSRECASALKRCTTELSAAMSRFF
jgi:IclR family transcriptional regulator, KDG regulon repressor